jgi:hypothetical protein
MSAEKKTQEADLEYSLVDRERAAHRKLKEVMSCPPQRRDYASTHCL